MVDGETTEGRKLFSLLLDLRAWICILPSALHVCSQPWLQQGHMWEPVYAIKRHFWKPLLPCFLLQRNMSGRSGSTVLLDRKFLPLSPHCPRYTGCLASPMCWKWWNVRKWLGHQGIETWNPYHCLCIPQAFSKWPKTLIKSYEPHSCFWNSLPEPFKRGEAELKTQDWGRWEYLLEKRSGYRDSSGPWNDLHRN